MPLVVSLVYLLFRRALAVAALRLRSREFKELEVFLAAASRLLSSTGQQSFFVRPDTLLGWHRRLVRKRWTYAGAPPGQTRGVGGGSWAGAAACA